MLAMLLLMNFVSSALKEDIEITENIAKIEAGILQLRSHEKDFLARKKTIYIEAFNSEILVLQKNIKDLKGVLRNNRVHISSVKLITLVKFYQQFFNNLVEAQTRIGFDLQSGYNGELNRTAQAVEKAIGNSVIFSNMMLQIKNTEKNYMLHHDDLYIDTFYEDVNRLNDAVENSFLVQSQKNSILNSLESYKTVFSSLAKEQQSMGYNANEGFQKALNVSALKVQLAQVELVRKAHQASNEYLRDIMQITYIVSALALLLSIFIGWALSNSIMSAILHIKNSIVKITETNDLTISVSTKSNDELSDMANSFNYMISNFKSLLASVKKSESTSDKATEILAENSLWADFIYEECLNDTDSNK
ncbi:MAG: methyl-accepting chemotaxis protein [Oleiphilaceae bacterium]|jgi:methyl-accepting chemotaxis protein